MVWCPVALVAGESVPGVPGLGGLGILSAVSGGFPVECRPGSADPGNGYFDS